MIIFYLTPFITSRGPPSLPPHKMYLSVQKGSVGRPATAAKFRVTDITEVNVGGVVFTTTLGRLVSVEGSTLKQIMEEKAHVDKEGRIFLDRDGAIFGYVLEHLRDRSAPLPEDKLTLQRIRNDATYFGLASLIEAVERKLQMTHRPDHPRLVEVKLHEASLREGLTEVLCIPLVPGVLQPLFRDFDSIPFTDIGKDATRLFSVANVETTTQAASMLHEMGGYRTIGFSNGAILMQRDDALLR